MGSKWTASKTSKSHGQISKASSAVGHVTPKIHSLTVMDGQLRKGEASVPVDDLREVDDLMVVDDAVTAEDELT